MNIYAFPVPNDADNNGHSGMTLRDYFAAKAMQGALAGLAGATATEIDVEQYRAGLAAGAYALADAMLIARAKPQSV